MSARFVLGLAIVVLATLSPPASRAADPLPRAVLILDQSDAHSAWYARFSSAFRSTLGAATSGAPVSIYAEHLDLSRFEGAQHDAVLRAYLGNKFRDRPIGVLVAQGSSSLAFLLRWRAELGPAG